MLVWTNEVKKKIATKIANRLEDSATTRLTERYYENEENKINFYIDEVVEKEVEEYFGKIDIDDISEELPDEMFDEDGYFKDKEYDINDEVEYLLYDFVVNELSRILKNYADDFDYSDPNSLSTYGLSQKDFI